MTAPAEKRVAKAPAKKLVAKVPAKKIVAKAASTTAIIKYDHACQAIAEATRIDVVKDWADKAAAFRVYAQRAKNRRLEVDAAEIRIRAERRMGELIRQEKGAGRLNPGTRGQLVSRGVIGGSASEPPIPKLSTLGIDKKLSMNAQRLAALPASAFEKRLATWRDRIVRQGDRISVTLVRHESKGAQRASREAELGKKITALPEGKFGVILADPEWRFEVYSRETGLDRSADNHYPTSTVEEIAARPVAEIAADDCALFLWAPIAHLRQAFGVIEAWGFNYVSHVVWRKVAIAGKSKKLVADGVAIGTGYWFRGAHELLLLGTKGNVPCPAAGEQWASIIDHPPIRVRERNPDAAGGGRIKHSAKPAIFYALIEDYFPTLPKIELNARTRRKGWAAWGNEAPAEPAPQPTAEEASP